MADFKITRSAGLTTLTPLLRAIVYSNILAAWRHDSGAWLVIAECPSFPGVLNVHWRSTDHYSENCLEYVDAFENSSHALAWARALGSAENAWAAGPSEALAAKATASAEKWKSKLQEGGTRGGQQSGKVRAEMSEARKDAEELGKRFHIHFVPQHDPRVWTFNPIRDTLDRPVINFTWKKQQQTYAYMGLEPDGQSWEIGRGWFPGMNDDNARIEEVCKRKVEGVLLKGQPAVLMLERLLKTDPEHWLKGDYVRFA